MTVPVAFPDCANPDDCECLKRGYELERDKCAVPQVRQAVADLGLELTPEAEHKLGLRSGPKRLPAPGPRRLPAQRPQPIATPPIGSIFRLGVTGNLAADTLSAAEAAGCDELSEEVIARCIDGERESRGLRAEAGYGSGAFSCVLFTHSEVLANGKRVFAFLTLMALPHGDSVGWNIGLGEHALTLAHRREVETVLEMLRHAAGGPSTEITDYRPT